MSIDRIVPQRINLEGLELALEGSLLNTDQFVFRNNGRTFLYVTNGAVAANFTFAVTRKVGDEEVTDRAVTVPANENRYIGPFPEAVFNNQDGDVEFTIDDTGNVTIAVLEL